jgi:hypothetical protein
MRGWLRKLGLAAMILACAYVLAGFVYQLYVAWAYQLVVGRRAFAFIDPRWTGYEEGPLWFWWAVATDGLLAILLVGFLLFLLWAYRDVGREERLFQRRATRPPLEDGIRQDISER